MSATNIINSVRRFLKTQHMLAEEEWLSGCVHFFIEEFGNDNLTVIQNKAKEQWLLNNLTIICPGSLPAGLQSIPKTCLNDCFVLQINAVMDIGTPAYQQYLKLQKVNTENIDATTKFDEKVPNHRMIKLYMTDGVQEVTGIEYKPMRNLNLDITPGCKVLIKGPVECRRGTILLTESSIELLGGEVEELMSNSQAFLLSAKLGVPMSQESNLNATSTQPRNTNVPTPHTQMPPPILEPTFDQASRPVAVVTSIQVAEFADDDIDVDELNAIEAQLSENSTKRPTDDDIQRPDKKLKMNPTSSMNTVDDYPDEADMYLEDDDYLKQLDAQFDEQEKELYAGTHKAQIPMTLEPYVYLKQIHDLSDQEKAGKVFKVKGQILKLLSKLSVSNERWVLKCTIVDGTGSLDVDFTSDVLSKLVGLTPQEMYRTRKEMSTKSEMKEKLVLALENARKSLEVLYCIIELTILDTPKITNLIPFENAHVELLQKRLETSLLRTSRPW